MALLTLPALGEDRSLAAGLRACEAIAAPDARLACFDALAAGVTDWSMAGPKFSMPKSAPSRPETAPDPGSEDRFGREQALVSEASSGPEALSEIQSRISALRRQGNGRLVFELDNGQVWLQAVAALLAGGQRGRRVVIGQVQHRQRDARLIVLR